MKFCLNSIGLSIRYDKLYRKISGNFHLIIGKFKRLHIQCSTDIFVWPGIGNNAHWQCVSRAVVREKFDRAMISKGGDIPCSATRSPDLSVCDYSLWDYLVTRVH